MPAPKRPTNLSDPNTPDEADSDEVPVPEEMPIDDGAPLDDWEIPTGFPDVIV